MTRLSRISKIITIIIICLLTGCNRATNHLTITPMISSTPTELDSSPTSLTTAIDSTQTTITPAPSPIPVVTKEKFWTPAAPQPTLTNDLQDQLYGLLATNGDCGLPCFLGIMPGETTWGDARNIIERFAYNSPLSPDDIASNPPEYMYSVSILTSKDIRLFLHMKIEVIFDRVEKIIFDSTIMRGTSLVGDDDHLSKYSLRSIFLEYGQPDLIYIDPPIDARGYWIDVFYLEEKVMIQYGGTAKPNNQGGYTLCPNIGEGDISGVQITLANPSSSIDIRTLSLIDFQGDQYAFPIETAIGMSIQDFFNFILDNQPACFQFDTP